MSTETPSSIEQTSALIHRLVKQMMTFLEVEEITNSTYFRNEDRKRSSYVSKQLLIESRDSWSLDIGQNVNQKDSRWIKSLRIAATKIRRKIEKTCEGYCIFMQNHCEMKLFVDYLEDELKTTQKEVTKLEA